jgi:Ca2+-binding EF-hand superfamily protein
VTNEYKATFDLLDSDGDGFIDVNELGRLMEALGHDANIARVIEVMVAADLSRDGKISPDEFAAFMSRA